MTPRKKDQLAQKKKKNDKPKVTTITVELNGSHLNPYHKAGLTQNPFSQLGKAETDSAEQRLNSLGGDPIPQDNSEAYIRERLAGFAPEFIDLCVQNFRPGKIVKFKVYWPADS